MSTEELLAVLEDGAAATVPLPERRLRVVPPPDEDVQPAVTAPPAEATAAAPRRVWAPTPAPVAHPGLRKRLRCARHGHDPRPHRPLPHDEVVYRCLRCGRPMPAPPRP